MTQDLAHRLTRMTGRDPHESHRAATPLELLYDLTFVIAFGLAADELAHALSADHLAVGLGGFAFALFSVTWAWIQYTWFASAFDTDDWLCRVMVMVQMLGVVILALGLPDMFASLEHGEHLDNRVMVLGYVVMRVPMVALWLRAALADPDHRRAPLIYVVTIVVSQTIWCYIALAPPHHRDDPAGDGARPADRDSAARSCASDWRSPSASRGTRTTSPSATGCS